MKFDKGDREQQCATFIARDLQHCTTAVVHVPSVALTIRVGGVNAKSEAIVKWPDLDTNSMASNSWQGEHLPTSTELWQPKPTGMRSVRKGQPKH